MEQTFGSAFMPYFLFTIKEETNMSELKKRTTESTLEEIKGYGFYLTPHRIEMISALVTKLDQLTITPVPMTGTAEDVEDNTPGIYWDNGVWYFDIDLNEDDKTFSLYGKCRENKKEVWIEQFTLEDVTPEWVTQHLAAIVLIKA